MREESSATTRRRLLVVDGSARFLLTVRGPVLKAAVQAGHEVTACAAMDTSMPDVQIDDLRGKYRAMGVTFHELAMRRQGTNPLGDLRTLVQLWGLMRRLRPDVVLSYSIKSSLYGSLAARLARIPESYSAITGLGYLFSSDSGKLGFAKRLIQRLLGIALAGNKRVFFQNPDDRDLFLHLRLLRNRDRSVIVNGSGVNLERFAEAPFPGDPTTFLMVARLQYHKGVVEYVQAARMLKSRYPEIRLQLLGPLDDHPSAIPRSTVEGWRQEGSVEFLGGTPDVRPFLERCHVYVLPSYREGTPLSALEAMATGRPVVTTDVPGCRETVVAGLNGLLVPVKDAEALAEAMERFLRDPGLVAPMGKQSRRIAEEKYDVNKVVAVMMRAMNLWGRERD